MQGVFEFCTGLPARPRRPERLFFGLFPDARTARTASELAGRFARGLSGARFGTRRLHISLHHVGDYRRLRAQVVYAARQAGDAVAMPPFAVTFNAVGSFEGAPQAEGRPRRWPLVLRGTGGGLFALHALLGAAMTKNGLQAAERFVPHMTLLYGAEPVPLQLIDPIRFVVREFSLVHSELWLTRYNVIGRWPLEGRSSHLRRLQKLSVQRGGCETGS